MRIASFDLLRPAFADRVRALLEALRDDAIPLEVFETIRSPARQMELYARGREDPGSADFGRTVTDARPYISAHQHGLAVDLVFRVGGVWTWDEPARGMWDQRDLLATRIGGLCHLLRHDGQPRERPHIQDTGFHSATAAVGPPDTTGWLEWLRAPRVG